jgi:hypothetical protein
MSASSAPTLINLPPLPKPRTVNELANSINYTYREINRAFTIISRAFVFEKTLITGNVTTVGTQIGGFLISDTKLVSTDTVNGTQIGLYSAANVSGATSFALIAGDVATSGTQAVTIGNGSSYGHLVQVNGLAVAQLRRGLFNNHGYLGVTKSDGTTNVLTANGNTNQTTIGGTLGVAGLITGSAGLTVTGITTLEVLQFSAGGYLKFPSAFVAGAPAATGYLIARDNVGAIYKLLCAP